VRWKGAIEGEESRCFIVGELQINMRACLEVIRNARKKWHWKARNGSLTRPRLIHPLEVALDELEEVDSTLSLIFTNWWRHADCRMADFLPPSAQHLSVYARSQMDGRGIFLLLDNASLPVRTGLVTDFAIQQASRPACLTRIWRLAFDASETAVLAGLGRTAIWWWWCA
jgi:hypothetical protein